MLIDGFTDSTWKLLAIEHTITLLDNLVPAVHRFQIFILLCLPSCEETTKVYEDSCLKNFLTASFWDQQKIHCSKSTNHGKQTHPFFWWCKSSLLSFFFFFILIVYCHKVVSFLQEGSTSLKKTVPSSPMCRSRLPWKFCYSPHLLQHTDWTGRATGPPASLVGQSQMWDKGSGNFCPWILLHEQAINIPQNAGEKQNQWKSP